VPRIEDAYLDKAIREMHLLEERMDACLGCQAGGTFPVKASGSPTADIMLIKWQSSLSERQEGVSFFGRSGEAVRRSVERLQVDPAVLYGTLVLKCPHADPAAPMGNELEWLAEEIRIVRPRLMVVMGDRTIAAVDALRFPMSEPLPVEQGVVTRISTTRSTSRTPSAASGPRSAPWAIGTRPSPPGSTGPVRPATIARDGRDLDDPGRREPRFGGRRHPGRAAVGGPLPARRHRRG
jgi:uracil-DNA glycosylase